MGYSIDSIKKIVITRSFNFEKKKPDSPYLAMAFEP